MQSGPMEDCQNAFQMILEFLHRETVEPNYLEDYIQANKDGQFKMDSKLDRMGCEPTCAAHSSFGI